MEARFAHIHTYKHTQMCVHILTTVSFPSQDSQTVRPSKHSEAHWRLYTETADIYHHGTGARYSAGFIDYHSLLQFKA